MAITTLYFGESSAGAADGTSWANRAAFVSGGAVNTLISAFDFTTNSLVAMVGPGTHTLTTGIATFTGATAPTFKIPCIIQACDSNGAQWVPPNPGWVSAEPVWDTSGMPVIATTTNITTINNGAVACRGIKFTSSGNTSNGTIQARAWMDWCYILNSASNVNNTGVGLATSQADTNCCVSMTGTAYSYCAVFGQQGALNCRMQGNLSASSGNRNGVVYNSNNPRSLRKCTIVNHVGYGVNNINAGASTGIEVFRCTIANCGGDGVIGTGTGSTITTVSVINCMISGNGGYGVNSSGTGTGIVANSRIRDNSSGAITGLDGWPTDQDNYTLTGADDDEYVNVAGLDFRIKNTSIYWMLGVGAGDQPQSIGGGGHIIGS